MHVLLLLNMYVLHKESRLKTRCMPQVNARMTEASENDPFLQTLAKSDAAGEGKQPSR
jgi:hypothetical protein